MSGQLIAVVDLRILWNLPTQEQTLYTPLVVLAGQHCAFKVDRIDNVVTISQDVYQTLHKNQTLNNCVEATCRISNNTVYVLNVDQILLVEEQTRLTDLQQKMEKRLRQLEAQSS